MQLSNQCQWEVLNKLNGHPVLCVRNWNGEHRQTMNSLQLRYHIGNRISAAARARVLALSRNRSVVDWRACLLHSSNKLRTEQHAKKGLACEGMYLQFISRSVETDQLSLELGKGNPIFKRSCEWSEDLQGPLLRIFSVTDRFRNCSYKLSG